MNYVGRKFCRLHPGVKPTISGKNKCCPKCKALACVAAGKERRRNGEPWGRDRFNHEPWEAYARRKGFTADERVPGDVNIALTYKADVMPRGAYTVRG